MSQFEVPLQCQLVVSWSNIVCFIDERSAGPNSLGLVAFKALFFLWSREANDRWLVRFKAITAAHWYLRYRTVCKCVTRLHGGDFWKELGRGGRKRKREDGKWRRREEVGNLTNRTKRRSTNTAPIRRFVKSWYLSGFIRPFTNSSVYCMALPPYRTTVLIGVLIAYLILN